MRLNIDDIIDVLHHLDMLMLIDEMTDKGGGLNRVPFTNHQLLDQIRERRSNRRAKIIYGD